MMEQPLVSIIITNFNYAAFIRECIDSALGQTYPFTEIIVVDDGSTDESQSIILSYGDQLTHVFKNNGGQGSAFNAGFDISRGDIILFLDADDCLLLSAADKVVSSFKEGEMVKAHWPLYVIDRLSFNSGQLTPTYGLLEGNLVSRIISLGPNAYVSPPTSGNAWNRAFLSKVLPMPSESYMISADLYLCMLAPLYGHIKTISEPLSLYRLHGDNNFRGKFLSDDFLNKKISRFEESCEILREHFKRMNINVNPDQWRKESWLMKLNASINDIKKFVPENEKLILADGDQWQVAGELAGRKIIPIMQKDQQYWGQPSSDEEAIHEIESQVKQNAGYIFFAWPVFWWLDYYKQMVNYLDQNHTQLIRNERLVGYKLNNMTIRAE